MVRSYVRIFCRGARICPRSYNLRISSTIQRTAFFGGGWNKYGNHTLVQHELCYLYFIFLCFYTSRIRQYTHFLHQHGEHLHDTLDSCSSVIRCTRQLKKRQRKQARCGNSSITPMVRPQKRSPRWQATARKT